MRKRMRRVAVLFAVLVSLLAAGIPVYASDPLTNHITGWPYMEDINEDSAVLIDADNGAVLYSLDRDTRRYPASTTKILTCLLVVENSSMGETVTISEEAMAVAIAGNSNINPVLGEQFSMEDCLYMLMLKSANDIAVQLAVHVGGSVENFAAMMNERAEAIGCTGTHFTNPSGLPDENHYTTAHDLALIMQECLKNDTFRKLISTKIWTVGPTNMTPESRIYENHNALIMDGEYYYEYCIGGKTGYTDAAQRTLVCAAVRDGRTLVGVTMHGPDRSDFGDMIRLFEYGYQNFSRIEIAEDPEGAEADGSVTLPDGIGLDQLVSTAAVNADGKTVTSYSYENLPVGRIVRTGLTAAEREAEAARIAEEEEKARSEAEAAREAAEKEKQQEEKRAQRSARWAGVARVLRVFLIVLAVLCAAFLVLTLIASSRRKKRRRRKAQQRRRAAGQNSSGKSTSSAGRTRSSSARSGSSQGKSSTSGKHRSSGKSLRTQSRTRK